MNAMKYYILPISTLTYLTSPQLSAWKINFMTTTTLDSDNYAQTKICFFKIFASLKVLLDLSHLTV